MKFLKKLFSKSKTDNSKIDQTYIDLLISLNKNFEVDLTLFVDCDYKKNNLDLYNYIIVCSRFLNLDTNKIKHQIIDILNNQIKNTDNEQFISSLVTILDSGISTSEVDNFYIKPSQVFNKYIYEHNK